MRPVLHPSTRKLLRAVAATLEQARAGKLAAAEWAALPAAMRHLARRLEWELYEPAPDVQPVRH
jgi:hypothetical protein